MGSDPSVQRVDKWILLESFNLSKLSYSHPIIIDNNNYIIINKDAIYRYNIEKNRWKKSRLKRIIPSYKHTEYVVATEFNHATFVLSICMAYPKHNCIKWMELDLNDDALKWKNKSPLLHLDHSANTKILNDELHIISDSHSIWDSSTNKFCKLYDFKKSRNCIIAHRKTKQSLILIQRGNKDYIYEYDIKTKQWKKTVVRRPDLSKMPCVLCCNNDKYILFVGGTLSKNIWIYDYAQNNFRKSNIECPFDGGLFRGVIVNNYHKSDLLLNGYLNGMEDIFIIKDVISLIHSMIIEEYILLLQIKTGLHFKIALNDIL